MPCRFCGRAGVTGRMAVVTGANTGIGRETAVAFAREGAKVIATGRNTGEGRKTEVDAKAAAADGGDCVYHYQDIQREDEWAEIVGGAAAVLRAVAAALQVLVEPLVRHDLGCGRGFHRLNRRRLLAPRHRIPVPTRLHPPC